VCGTRSAYGRGIRKIHRISIRKYEGERPFGKLWRKWENKVFMETGPIRTNTESRVQIGNITGVLISP